MKVTNNNLDANEDYTTQDTPIVNAIKLGLFQHGSQEWHDARAGGIGGSEVGTILGLNKWQSPYELWARKTGLITEEVATSPAMEWGTRLEPVILEKFADSHPELTVFTDVGTYHHSDRPWQIANPDGLYLDREGNYGLIEVKTASMEGDWIGGVPDYYETQVQWYLDALNLEHAYVIVLISGRDYREFEVKRSRFQQDYNIAEVEKFRQCVLDKVAPEIDGHAGTYDTLRTLQTEVVDEGVELGWLGVQYFGIEEKYRGAEYELNKVKSAILDAMGSAKTGTIDGVTAFARYRGRNGTPYLKTIKKGK